MNLARISKKQPHADSRQTLDALHKEKLEEFQEQYRQLPDLEKKLENLIYTYESTSYKGDVFKLYDEICVLQKHVEKIKDGVYESHYLIKAAPYLLKYGETNNVSKVTEENANDYEEESDTETDFDTFNDISGYINQYQMSNKGEICENFVTECICDCNIYNKTVYEERLTCKCGGYRNIIIKEAIAVCIECGDVVQYQDSNTHPQYSDEVEILSQFALILALKSILLYVSRHYTQEPSKISGMKDNDNLSLISC